MRYNEFENRIHPNGCTGIYSLRQYFYKPLPRYGADFVYFCKNKYYMAD